MLVHMIKTKLDMENRTPNYHMASSTNLLYTKLVFEIIILKSELGLDSLTPE